MRAGRRRLCGRQPEQPITFDDEVINTDTSAQCDVIASLHACVIYAESIALPRERTVRFHGDTPVVLAARTTISIDGVLDVSSYVAPGPGVVGRGAGATGEGCPAGDTMNSGGSPGGSFGGSGGIGGSSAVMPGPTSGIPGAPRGGCPGGNASSSGVPPSLPGGGVWLLAGGAITIGATGIVAANGAGGNGGDPLALGGYGAGSGGLVRIAAPTLVLDGLIVAHPGAGGGGGAQGQAAGRPGQDGRRGAAPALGGTGMASGGDGGTGAAGDALDGAPGIKGLDDALSGGGGGGAGIIAIEATRSGAGITSPPPRVP